VFSLTPPATTGGLWTEAVIHSFGLGSDGSKPDGAGVVIGARGTLYGTTQRGGTSNLGTVFSMTPPVSGRAWTETVLYNFTNGSDCAGPASGVAMGKDGVLYGSSGGGTGYGTVFSSTP
jgi:uncharacterized repeat protein (TIGR03803 family)